MAVETPHFAHPFAIVTQPNGSLAAAVREQDGIDEITDCVARIVSYQRGERDELPEFGISDPLFTQQPTDMRLLAAEIAEWEDRVEVEAEASVDSADELIEHVRLNIEPTSEGAD
jgi:phage baseplate assembly protein W